MELFHGTKNFKREDWPFEKRLQILDDLAAIPKTFDLPICFGITDRKDAPQHLDGPASPSWLEQIIHANSFFKFVVHLEIIMRGSAQDEVAMLIAEDRDRVRKMLKIAHAMFRGRAPRRYQEELEKIREGLIEKVMPLQRIVETVHFVQKSESSLLQVADICAFAIKRNIMKASHCERLYEPLDEQIVFRPRVIEALAATAQPS
jgi:hypothetical protein